MKINRISTICSSLLITLGTIVLLGWFFHIPRMVQVIPGLVGMVANTATLFILSGLLLIIFNRANFHWQSFFANVISTAILIIALLSLSQDIFQYDLGIDRMLYTPWLDDPNPTPGRMAPNTSLGFIFTAMIAFLMPYGHKKSVAIAIQVLTFFILIIALLGLLVYSLKLEFIFSWYRYTRMAVHTACGFLIISIGWWATWSQSRWCQEFYKGNEDKKIILITGIILMCLLLLGGLGGIAGLTYLNVSTVYQSLQQTLDRKINIFVNSVNTIKKDAESYFKNPLVVEAIENNNNPIYQKTLNQINYFLTTKGFTAIQLTDTNGKVLLNLGSFIKPTFSVQLNLPEKTQLLWNNGFWIRITFPITSGSNNQVYGYFLGEAVPTAFNLAYQNYHGLGATGEILFCAKADTTNAQCFPTRFTPQPFNMNLININKPRPIYYALSGETGTINIIDYRGKNVIAAYSPVEKFNLGMVVKINTTEVYQPINNQLKIILPIGIFLIFSGLILLYWQVVPLVKKVVSSEHEANESKLKLIDSNKKLAMSLKELKERNAEISVLKELSATLPTCLNIEEAKGLIAKYGLRLFPQAQGILFLMNPSHQYLEFTSSWGNPLLNVKTFRLDDCWALRRGSIHKVLDPAVDLICLHSKELASNVPSYVCIPLLSEGNLGLLYLESMEFNSISNKESEKFLLPVTFAEQISLGISNIKMRETLRNQSLHDPLTGLYNRRYLEEIMEQELIQHKRNSLPLSILMLDIDHFKHFNDEFGHDAGDIVLKALAQLLLDNVRAHDFVCRFGGEEFLFVIPGANREIAINRATELHKAVQQLKLNYGSQQLGPITISIGISVYPDNGDKLEDLIKAADLALYTAKNTGRNKTVA